MITACLTAAAILAALILLASVRLMLGPTAPDRAVALDSINTLLVATMILLSVGFDQPVFVDVAVVYALLSFVGTLFIAKYLNRKAS